MMSLSTVVTAKKVCAALILLAVVVRSTLYSFSLTGPSKPVFDQQLATITVLDNYRLELDVVFDSQPSYNEWTSIFQVGSDADQRLPALFWRNYNNGRALTMFTTTNEGSSDGVSLSGFSLGSTFPILMELVDGVYRIEVNGHEYYRREPRTLQCAESLPLWFSAPYADYGAANCTVSNLLYQTWDAPTTTTSSPTEEMNSTLAAASTTPVTSSTSTKPTTPVTSALPTTTLDSNDSDGASLNWALILGVVGGGVGFVLVSAFAIAYFLRTARRQRENVEDVVNVTSETQAEHFEEKEEVVVVGQT